MKIFKIHHKERAVEYMIVKTTAEAWEAANKMLPTDYQKDEESSQRAGYPIYRSTAVDHYNFYICDLNDRLEVNMNGESVNIWIREEEQGEDVEVTVIAKTGETRTYTTYAAYRKDFRFFWSSGKTNEYEDAPLFHVYIKFVVILPCERFNFMVHIVQNVILIPVTMCKHMEPFTLTNEYFCVILDQAHFINFFQCHVQPSFSPALPCRGRENAV